MRNERRREFAGPSLSIVTFNMLSGGPFPGILGLPGSETIYDSTMRERLALQAAGLVRVSPDIVVLQEVSGTTPERYCSMLDALLEGVSSAPGGEAGYNVAYARGDHDPVANRWYSGLAVLSRFELRDPRTYTFSAQGTFGLEDRVALKVSIHGEREDVDVVTTHLHSNDDGLAAVQVEELLEWIRQVTDPNTTTILAGDFNLVPDSHPMRRIRGAHFVDAWQEARPRDPGFTFGQPDLEDPAARANERIDYVFVSEGTSVTSAAIVLNTPANLERGHMVRWLWPSDHYGVRTDVVPIGY